MGATIVAIFLFALALFCVALRMPNPEERVQIVPGASDHPETAARSLDAELAETKAAIEALRIELAEATRTITIAAERERLLRAELQALYANQQTAPQGTSTKDAERFHKLKALIAQECHPDHAASGSVDAAIKGAVFAALWSKVEAI